MKKLLSVLLLFALLVQVSSYTVTADTRPAPEDRGSSGLALALRRLQTIASVLHTAAHPDDEPIWPSIVARAGKTASDRNYGKGWV
jgi:hypothetical protein